LPTITAELTQKELEAITEYANLCGETISDLVRKALIREVTLADGYGADDPQYEYQMTVPAKVMRSTEHKIVQENYNKIRRILGWKEIKL
jgi:glutathionyl-hydroquinone reductase